MKRHYLSPLDVSPDERAWILRRAAELKRGDRRQMGRRVGSLFFNPSLRTRVSWEQAAGILGCRAQTLNAGSDLWAMEMDPDAVMDSDRAECVTEAAGVLGRFFDVLGVRSFPQGRGWDVEREEPVLKAFSEKSGTSIVSLEGALHHPCQSLADHLTLHEHFGQDLRGVKVVLMWAWHPKSLPTAVPNSFALQASLAGADLVIAHPEGYDLDSKVMEDIRREAQGEVKVVHDLEAGLRGAQAVYVKSWGRLDQPGVPPEAVLRDWQMTDDAWKSTASARIMHCLPVRRNVEISSQVLDSDRSIVLEEAENRLWAQAGLLEFLLSQQGGEA